MDLKSLLFLLKNMSKRKRKMKPLFGLYGQELQIAVIFSNI